jgi:[ribosomal protein S5]-alanine N-acetyltransferase
VTHPVEIRTDRLFIREFSTDDAQNLLALTSDPDVVRYLEFGPTSRAESMGLVDFATTSSVSVPRRAYVLAIVDSTTRAFIGSCGVQASDDDSAAAEVYFVFRRERWGQGLATELLPALLGFAQGAAGFERVYAVVHPDKVASIRVLENVGMGRDGEVPCAFPDLLRPEGRWRDGLRYAILR